VSIIANVLRAAKAKVQHRWIQNRAQDVHGGVCAGYAMDKSLMEELGITALETDEQRKLQTATWNTFKTAVVELHPDIGDINFSVPAWNDASFRTRQEVEDAFDRALKIAERDEE